MKSKNAVKTSERINSFLISVLICGCTFRLLGPTSVITGLSVKRNSVFNSSILYKSEHVWLAVGMQTVYNINVASQDVANCYNTMLRFEARVCKLSKYPETSNFRFVY